MSDTEHSLSEGLERELSLNRWAIAGTYAIGAFVIYLVMSQLASFERSLTQITAETRTSLISVSASMNAVAAKLERVDERVDYLKEARNALRDHERLPASQAHARESR